MGMNKIELPDLFHSNRLTHLLYDDFDSYTDSQQWTKLAADGGSSVAAAAGVGGLLRFTTGATDNNEVSVVSTNLNFLHVNNQPMVCEWRINYTENATNKANIAAGLSTIFSANFLVDNGAGPAASFDGAIIFKVDGGTAWKTCSSIAGTQTIKTSTTTAGGVQTLRIEINFVSGTLAEITYYVNGSPLMDASQTARNIPIKDTVTFTGGGAMGPGLYLKAGGAGGEVLDADYVIAAQSRV